MKNYETWVVPAILLVGFGLRLIGLNVGLPDSPDPREVLIAQDVLNVMHFTAPPEIYNWPGTAWFYLIAAIGKLFALGKLLLPEEIATGGVAPTGRCDFVGAVRQRAVVNGNAVVYLSPRRVLL